ncbi:MAG: NAD(P)-binding protein [Pseudomonadota bacterium]
MQKIAVIGGGVGAITAVYAITQTPDWDKKYEIHLYQMGWRLGGKGASGRNMEKGGRIEEHGLHVWAGFYENAFRNMRACYEELVTLDLRKADDPLGTLEAAFKPLSHLFLAEDRGNGDWRPWLVDLPKNNKVPGAATTAPTPFEMFLEGMSILKEFLEKGELAGLAKNHLGVDIFADLLARIFGLHSHAHGMPRHPGAHVPQQKSLLVDLIRDAQKAVQDQMTAENMEDDATRRILYLMDISMAYAHGVVSSDTFAQGYDPLDQWEFSDWLLQNGATDASMNSVLIRGCYDFVFGFPNSNISRGNSGAGTAIRAMGRLILTYAGAIFHKMQAGMGDTIFGPYYQVLKAKGVKFHFFEAARELHLCEHKERIQRISMVRQAHLKDEEYDPLVTVENLPCWPSEPKWDKLKHGEKLKRDGVDFECEKEPPKGEWFDLEHGRDFDHVILGASIGSLPYMTQELAHASQRWRRMLREVETVATQAAQFWVDKTAEELGWDGVVAEHNPEAALPKPPMRTVITGFAEPLDTWADMSHLLPREAWPEPGPKSIAYFCSPAVDGQTLDGFKAKTAVWADTALTKFWPKADKNGTFDRSLLHGKGSGEARFDDQYFRVNMYGSERYVLSVAGSLPHRLAPDESGFENLTLAGDWTRCGLNAGCVEAATMSGIAAASAVTGEKLLNVGAKDVAFDAGPVAQSAYQTNSISDAPWPLSGFFARGSMTGWFVFYAMPRDEVQKLLPEGAWLGNCPHTPAGYHSVGISLCAYHKVRSSFLPISFSPYLEASFAIPYMRTELGGDANLLYPRRLYVNNSLAIFVGKTMYDMNKAPSTLKMDDESFTSKTSKSPHQIDAKFFQRDDLKPLSDYADFGAISDILNQTFVTGPWWNGGFAYNCFNLQLERAYAAPVVGHIKVEDNDAGGFPALDKHFSALGAAGGGHLPGGFRIWTSWSMTNPLDSKRIRHAAKAQAYLRRSY